MKSSKEISRRNFLRVLGSSAASLSVAPLVTNKIFGKIAQSASADSNRPNIILILADDMGYSDIGCYGGEINTPNIDKLADNGIRFNQFYNAARCCPTRASLLTGLYPHQAGIGGMVSRDPATAEKGPYQGYLNDKCVTIAEVLKQAGYNTAMSGKWHVGEKRPHWPVDRGFDNYFGLINGASNYFEPKRVINERNTMAIDGEEWEPPKEDFYMTDAITDNAINYLKNFTKEDNPFFMYVSYTAPHYPLHAHEEDIKKYRGKYLKGWEELRKERYKKLIEQGIIDEQYPLPELDENSELWKDVDDKDMADLKMSIYAAMIDRMDQGIGNIIMELEKSGKKDNTLVLFLSDNGASSEYGLFGKDYHKSGYPPGDVRSYWSYGLCWANASNTPFRYFKKWIHEGGIATPLIAHWPKVIKEKGKITNQMGHVVDIMATCCDIAGVEYPGEYQGNNITPLEGKSLSPIFHGKKRNDEPIFWEHLGRKAVRQGKWKLVLRETGNWELYDMELDRTEVNNIIDKHPKKAEELKAMYNAWAQKCGVVYSEPPSWHILGKDIPKADR